MTDYNTTYIQCPVHVHYRLVDAKGCRECYREREKAGRPGKEKKAYKIPPLSEKKKKREAALAKVRQERKQLIKFCETCGKTGVTLTYSHIVKVSGYLDLEAHPENGILECPECHHVYEHGSLQEKMKQKSWPKKLAVILKLEPSYFNKLQLKD